MKMRIMYLFGLLLPVMAGQADAGVVFKFTEIGGSVSMTSSGSLDTGKLVVSTLPDGWGGVGTEHNSAAGDIDIMGDTSYGAINAQFGFSAGTDFSAISNPGGPFLFSNFSAISSGSTSFTTYSGFLAGFRQAGIGVRAADIVAGIWTPDVSWSYAAGATFASLGLVTGIYTVSDALTAEFITIQIGESAAVPEPASMAMWGLGAAGIAFARRRRSVC